MAQGFYKGDFSMLLHEFPPHMFERLPDEPFHYGDFPDLSAGVAYFRDLMGNEEWKERREAAAWRFYRSFENGGAKLVHGSGWIVLLRAA